MRTFLVYLKLELKRTFKSIPYFIAGAIVLVLLAGTIAFSASRMLYGDKAVGKITVGVVMPEDDKLAAMALSMVQSLDSVGSLCEFQYVEKSEGKGLLKKGSIFALMELPVGLVQGIMNGSNPPITITFPKNAGLEASVFKELTEAGTSMLGTAQAAIYGADEYLKLHYREDLIPQAEKDLNSIFMKYALPRESFFKTERVSAAGDVSVIVFFTISAAVMVLLLLGIPAAPMIRPYSKVMEQKLYLIGIGRAKRTAVRTLVLTSMLLLASGVPFLWCFFKGYLEAGMGSFLMWILICAAASGWILFLYELAGNTVTGILLVFFSTVVMLFISGGIVPEVFLPETLGSIGRWMPSAFLTDGLKWMVKGGTLLPAIRLLLMEGILFALSSAVRRDYE